MLRENLIMLRSIHGYSQEEVAEKIGISRQAYAKWESGKTVPDIEKCSLLAEVYGVTIDSLVKKIESVEEKNYGICTTVLQNDKNYMKFAHKKTNEEIQKMRMSLSKYVYCQYDLHNNLIKQYYLNDVKINFSEKIINILKSKNTNEYIQIDNYIWCKKLISKS